MRGATSSSQLAWPAARCEAMGWETHRTVVLRMKAAVPVTSPVTTASSISATYGGMWRNMRASGASPRGDTGVLKRVGICEKEGHVEREKPSSVYNLRGRGTVGMKG